MLTWVDIETTGLDIENDKLLEVGLAVTLDDLTLLRKVSFVVHLPFQNYPMPELVRNMHTKNGLLSECQFGASRLDVEQQLVAVMHSLPSGGGMAAYPMCGSSVHFDRAFLKMHMPRFEALFHYRNIDVSTVKELVNRWYPGGSDLHRPPQQKLHRVDPDLTDTIAEAAFYKELLFAK